MQLMAAGWRSWTLVVLAAAVAVCDPASAQDRGSAAGWVDEVQLLTFHQSYYISNDPEVWAGTFTGTGWGPSPSSHSWITPTLARKEVDAQNRNGGRYIINVPLCYVNVRNAASPAPDEERMVDLDGRYADSPFMPGVPRYSISGRSGANRVWPA